MRFETVHESYVALRRGLAGVVRGQERAIHELVVALFSGGHALLEGPPGLGKTLLVRSLAASLRAQFRRIQFTPDLMPADVSGTTIFRPQSGEFRFHPGPIFTQVLLADEINRTPPKTQAALLEAMQERQVTLDGDTHELPDPFFVVATQNPIEYEGTYPLPEAQLDRFLMKIRIDYPDEAAERAILDAHRGALELAPAGSAELQPVLDAGELAGLRRVAAGLHVADAVRDYVAALVRASREHRRVSLGGSTRAAVLLLFASQVSAACAGREYVRPDDVKEMAPAVLRHRLILRPDSEIEGVGADDVVAELLESVPVPRANEADGSAGP